MFLLKNLLFCFMSTVLCLSTESSSVPRISVFPLSSFLFWSPSLILQTFLTVIFLVYLSLLKIEIITTTKNKKQKQNKTKKMLRSFVTMAEACQVICIITEWVGKNLLFQLLRSWTKDWIFKFLDYSISPGRIISLLSIVCNLNCHNSWKWVWKKDWDSSPFFFSPFNI